MNAYLPAKGYNTLCKTKKPIRIHVVLSHFNVTPNPNDKGVGFLLLNTGVVGGLLLERSSTFVELGQEVSQCYFSTQGRVTT